MGKVVFRMAVVIAILMAVNAAAQPSDAELAKQLVEKAGITHGICCVAGDCGGALAPEIVRASDFLVQVLDPRDPMTAAADIAKARESAEKYGLPLSRIAIEALPLERLPFADNIIDLIVAIDLPDAAMKNVAPSEILRVLRPKGKAIAGTRDPGSWKITEKPAPAGTDNWSHWEHGPDNNPVSTDTVIRAPYMTQWFGLPYYIAMPAITTAAGGRTFVAMGHIAHHEREEAWLNTILARNGYNGAELWRRRLPDGYLTHRSAFIATDDVFYMINPLGEGLVMLDPETGRELDTLRVPEVRGEWKWIAIKGRTLFALAGRHQDPAETTIVRSLRTHWSWGELSKGYYEKRVPWGFGDILFAVDLDSRRLAWKHEERAPIDSRGMAVGDGKVFFYCPDAHLAGLDAKSGGVAWANDDPQVRSLIEEAGANLQSTPGFRTTCICVYTPKGLFYQGQTNENLVAISKDDGHLLWHRTKVTSNPNVIYIPASPSSTWVRDDRLAGNVLAGIGELGNTLVLDPATGDTIENLGFAKRSCARLTATPDSVFCRGVPEGVTRYDRAAKRFSLDGSMRPACNDGVMGANGLLYIGPWLCDCNLSLMGTVALCSAPQAAPQPSQGNRLEMAAGDSAHSEPPDDSESDWAVYRGSNAHSGSSKAALSVPLTPLWTYAPAAPSMPTAPIAAGGIILLADDNGAVRALDAVTGFLKWTFRVSAPIMQPPTICRGRAYVGAGDGYLYVLEAATGRLLWRFRIAPIERRMPVYGHLCSTWPVNSGVLVDNGVAYAAAGIVDYDGTYVAAVDAITGALRWENTTSGHLDAVLRKGISAQGGLAVLDDSLWMAGGNVISPAPYALADGAYAGPQIKDGLPEANRGEEIGVLRKKYLVFGGRLRYSASENVVDPGAFSIAVRRNNRVDVSFGTVAPVWDDDIMITMPTRESPPVCYDSDTLINHAAHAKPRGASPPAPLPAPRWKAAKLAGSLTVGLALAPNVVVVACRTPLPARLEPEWRVCALDRRDGMPLWEADVPSAIRLNGLAIDRDGRLIVELADGGLCCFGGFNAFHAYLDAIIAKGDADRLKSDLATVQDLDSRDVLITALEKLGVDVVAPAKEANWITAWRVLGPVPWDKNKNSMDKKFVGEPEVNTSRPSKINGKPMPWRPYVVTSADGRVNLETMCGFANCAAYACAQVDLPQEQDLLLKLGSNDGFKCWFNHELAGRFDGDRSYKPDQNTLKVHAKKGKNTILIKMNQIGGGCSVGVRLVDLDGNPIKN